MATHNDFGQEGEHLAALHLVREGYHILERNWRSSHHEVDIIAEWFGEIVFVEVKSRHSEAFQKAEEAVDAEKQKRLRLAADHYLNLYAPEAAFRFDVITIVGAAPPYTIQHLRWAFS